MRMCPLNLIILTIALEGLLFMSPGREAPEEGYRGIARYGNGFVAVGSEGRIDRISLSGELIQSDKFTGANFNCIFSNDEMTIAAGDNGTIVFSINGTTYRKAESSTDKDINSITYFKKTIVAGADCGEIITGDVQGRLLKIIPGVKGNIVSVSAGSSGCYGVTDEGEIIHSPDGIGWEIFDLNRVYSGYYKPGRFTRVLVTEDRIVVTGFRDDDSPLLMFSSHGKVWTDRILNYTDDKEMQGTLSDRPNDIFYDKANDEFFIACSKGKLIILPSCPHCNKLTVLTEEDLTGISSDGKTLIIVGSNFYIKKLNIR
jgi:hypothetical protein